MNIFFTASLRAKEKRLKEYTEIYKALCKKNHVFADHVFKLNIETVTAWEPEYHFEYYMNILKQIKDCDCFVVEITDSSVNIEYEISSALNLRKNIIVIYSDGLNLKKLEKINLHSDDEKIQFVRYTSENIEMNLDQALKNVKNTINKRFTMLLPSQIVNFLEKTSKEKQIPISVYLRQLIEREMDQR